MKAIKMLMMAALTIVSVSLFAQDSTKHKSKMQIMEQMKYSCPMKCEGEKTYDKPGKCPKCGMDLTKSKKEQMKMEILIDSQKKNVSASDMSNRYAMFTQLQGLLKDTKKTLINVQNVVWL